MSKGFGYEREICRCLSLWWTGGADDDVFWRTSGSGSRATNRGKSGKKTKNHYGDLLAADPGGQPLIDAICWEITLLL